HDLADLLRMRLGQAAAEDREVLAEDEDEPAVDRAVSGDDAVAGHLLIRHAEIRRAVLDEHVPLLEAVGIEQDVDTLARGQLAAFVLRVDPALSATEPCALAHLLEPEQHFLHCPSLSACRQESAG